MSNPRRNFIYNIIYQSLSLVIPLISAPYLARVIGADGVGVYSYTFSIVNYFMLLTMLGVNNYGNRSIAKVRDDKDRLSRTFFSIFYVQLFMGVIMLLLYTLYILVFGGQFVVYLVIESLFIISAILDINWYFFGTEQFKKTITRNSIIKIATLLLIFILVKNKNDLWKYTLIMGSMTLLSQSIMWFFLKKEIRKVAVSKKDILKHIKPDLLLFVPVIAVSLYKIMDKIMLGALSGVAEVGYYENAEKIIGIPLALISALGTVMLPRISNLFAKGKANKAKEYITKSTSFIMFLSLPMCAGLIGTGKIFAPLYFGQEFEKTGILIMMLAGTLPFMAFANILRTQYLIPSEKDRIYIVSVFLGAMVNLAMNIIFIPKLGSIGACIGTISAEFIVMAYQALKVRKELPVLQYLVQAVPFILKAATMLIIIYPLNYIPLNNWLRLGIQVMSGISLYCLLNLKYIKDNIDIQKILKRKSKPEPTMDSQYN